jgi:DNA polymerase-3 subunit epsilon
VRFDHPVLDTLLLASVVHPREASHGLEEIAARFGVAVSARHTAIGDALATAEVFLKLLRHLREQGVGTAAQQSYYARLRY